MTIGSLFSGIGGMELGLEMIGMGKVRWQCEIDPCARAVLAKHWPKVKRYDDVRSIDATAEKVDIICGGFPCQDISDAGTNHRRRGLDGERSGLWHEFARVVRLLQPSHVFVENVASLAERGLDRVLGDLASMGFDAEWGCFGACETGAPHMRKRLFILAHANGESEPARTVDEKVARLPAFSNTLWNGGLSSSTPLRMDDGVSGGVDRLRLLGNAVVPRQAAHAWCVLHSMMAVSSRKQAEP